MDGAVRSGWCGDVELVARAVAGLRSPKRARRLKREGAARAEGAGERHANEQVYPTWPYRAPVGEREGAARVATACLFDRAHGVMADARTGGLLPAARGSSVMDTRGGVTRQRAVVQVSGARPRRYPACLLNQAGLSIDSAADAAAELEARLVRDGLRASPRSNVSPIALAVATAMGALQARLGDRGVKSVTRSFGASLRAARAAGVVGVVGVGVGGVLDECAGDKADEWLAAKGAR